jgi:hypothetical protein
VGLGDLLSENFYRANRVVFLQGYCKKNYGFINPRCSVRLYSNRFLPVCEVSASAGGNYKFCFSVAVFAASCLSHPHIAAVYQSLVSLLLHFAGYSCLRYGALHLF